MGGDGKDMKRGERAAGLAVLAAALYAANIPLSKLLLAKIEPTMLAAFLYLGAGLGLLACSGAGALVGKRAIQEPLTKKELPYTAAMVALDIAAPILLMMGVARTNSANASLLNNFEIVATALVARLIFQEVISRKLYAAILLVTLASIVLGFEGADSFVFSAGSLFILGACACWGVENNCTKMISSKSSVEIVIIKGCCSGLGSLLVALALGERFPAAGWLLCALALGFTAYGLSINFYIMAQKDLGAAKTSAFYSVAPFLGAAFSVALLGERPGPQFYAALLIMLLATALMIKDTAAGQHSHERSGTHDKPAGTLANCGAVCYNVPTDTATERNRQMMKTIQYTPRGVCSRQMEIDVEDGVILAVRVMGGCNGNLKGVSALLKGMTVEDAIARMEGIRCGMKPTSCPDQLAQALKQSVQA